MLHDYFAVWPRPKPFNETFGPGERTVVATWWVRRQFDSGVSARRLADRWLATIKKTSDDPSSAKEYANAVLEIFSRRLKTDVRPPGESDETTVLGALGWLAALAVLLFLLMIEVVEYRFSAGFAVFALPTSLALGALSTFKGWLPLLRKGGAISETTTGLVLLTTTVVTGALIWASTKHASGTSAQNTRDGSDG